MLTAFTVQSCVAFDWPLSYISLSMHLDSCLPEIYLIMSPSIYWVVVVVVVCLSPLVGFWILLGRSCFLLSWDEYLQVLSASPPPVLGFLLYFQLPSSSVERLDKRYGKGMTHLHDCIGEQASAVMNIILRTASLPWKSCNDWCGVDIKMLFKFFWCLCSPPQLLFKEPIWKKEHRNFWGRWTGTRF